ncbi:hypothetical protein ACM0CO_18200, partial [Mycobacteroides abscessus subsp. abscessus]|uniref:hypothetical protein n=1 Tax=Mycobacteroides abscessus TaxID=36809 RepID=UPI0039EF92F8
MSAVRGECLGGFEAESGIGTGDDGDAAGLIGDVGGAPFGGGRGASRKCEREVVAGASRMVSAWGACVTS